MSYDKFYPGGWQSGESGGTPITPEALNHIENGIKQTYSDLAPAGYGLGDMLAEQPMIADAHEIWKTGWYRVHPSVTANVPVSGVLRAEVYAYRYVTLTLYTNEYLSNDTTILRQCLVDGVWQDWEFVNPPMQPGVEYRTTERWNGKPVYTKLVNCGTAVSGSTTVNTNTGNSYPIRCCAVIDNQYISPHIWVTPDNDHSIWVDTYKDSGYICLAILSGASSAGKQVYAQIWYYKD